MSFPRNYSGMDLSQMVKLNTSDEGEKRTKKQEHARPPSQVVRDDQNVPLIQALNTRPTLAIFGIFLVVFVPLSLFLDSYVAEATHSFAIFLVGSYLVWSSYFAFHFFLLKHSSSYGRIPIDKQFYVLSNFIKSALLLSYSPLAAKMLYDVIIYDNWNVVRIWNLGCLYAIPDFVSLFLVDRMAKTTVAHHVCVCIFMCISLNNSYASDGICQSIVIYAIWSDFSYLVNLLLASRFMEIDGRLSMYLSVLAGIIYLVCCGINWTWQVQYIWKLLQIPGLWSVYVYVPMLAVIVRDDVVLLKWLYSNACRKHEEISKKAA